MTPRLASWLDAGGAGLALGLAAAWVAARTRARGIAVPYTRKIFHFAVFSGAAVVHTLSGLGGTIVYGSVVAALVLVAVARGDGNPVYEALARDTDRPHRTFFILVPLVTTAVGGLASALVAGPYASVGYLVAGWGDAIAEPVGARWGRHPYRVPSLAGVTARRTVEGSTAVFLASWLAAALALGVLGTGGTSSLWMGGTCAVVATAVEAVSHHGADNLTVPLVVSTLAWLLAR